jgi:double-stranded uracil-DNA glycosylase
MKEGLAPVADDRARVLILGTLPGDESLRMGQYYANPRNQFWTILSGVLGERLLEHPYDARLELLRSRGFALWDVLRAATREGSLDSAISEGVANDFGSFFRAHPHVRRIGFNGGRAHTLFRRHAMGKASPPECSSRVLPSTSPTPGRNVLTLEQKILRWRQFFGEVTQG